jgi:hypothetical protein
MSGFAVLSEDEQRELIEDARDPERRSAFAAARRHADAGNLDDYIDFLSANMAFAGPSPPTPSPTEGNLL